MCASLLCSRGERVKQFMFVVVAHCISILLSILNTKTGLTTLNALIGGVHMRSSVLV